jgi:hypothetical protein
MADKKIVLLTDGTEAEFSIGSSLADIDKRLAAEGLERDKKSKPFAEVGSMQKAIGKAALPVVEGVSGILGLPGEVKRSLDVGGSELAKLFGFSPEQYQAAKQYLDVGGQVKQMVGADKLPSMEMPTSGQITDLARQAGIPMQRAETAPGRLAQTFARNVVGAPVKAALIPSAVSAVGEESLGGVFAGTPLEPYARMAGGVGLPLLL